MDTVAPLFSDKKPGVLDQAEACDLIVAYLSQLEVEVVFGIPGGAVEPMYNALARSELRGGPRPVIARHECGAAFMAEGYARETGKLGVCLATTGPGATNLITGVASAYNENIPILVITAQTALSNFGRGAFQESSCTGVDTVGMFSHCTRYNSLVSHVSQLEQKLVSAVTMAFQSPPGPVHLSIPLDIQRTPILNAKPSISLLPHVRASESVDQTGVGQFAEKLATSKCPVFIIGEGCSESAVDPLIRLVERTGACVITTPRGKEWIDPYHPQYQGVFGLAGHQSAYNALANPAVDLVVAIGTRMDEVASHCWDEKVLMTNRLVHIDAIPQNFTSTPMAQLHVTGNIRLILESVLSRLISGREVDIPPLETYRKTGETGFGTKAVVQSTQARPKSNATYQETDEACALFSRLSAEPCKCADQSVPIKPQRLMYELSTRFPANTRFLADSGNSVLWALHYLMPKRIRTRDNGQKVKGRVWTGMGFASMAWAIGGAVGVACGARGEPVVAIVGDGSMLMSGQELSVAVYEGLNIVFMILNDASLGTVKHGQRLAGAEQVGCWLPQVDFCKMAQAMGASGYRIRTPEDLAALDINALFKQRGPTVLDVYIDPEEVPPLRMRMESLGTGEG